MKRDIYKTLLEWKEGKKHKPLLLRGARQIGKTYTIKEFGQREFATIITLNFERNEEFKEIFNSYNPKDIIEKISLYTGKNVKPGKTLLFFDEIQECPRAIVSLRYFHEEMPGLHIISAGSLLEFTLESEDFKMPVGRIQYLYMFPLSFGEFLDAIGQQELRKYLVQFNTHATLPQALHEKLNEFVRKYFLIGGMPEVVQEYSTSQDIIRCQKIQRSIIETYVDDFAKYARKSKHRYLKKIFNAVPSMVGQKFMYSQVDNTIKSRDLKEALEILEMAGVVYRVRRTSGAGLPLEAGTKENYFKMVFLDVGLLHAVNGEYSDTAKAKDFTAIYKGAVAEQFTGQEIMAYHSPFSKPSLYYWVREAKNSNAELDYLIEKNSKIIPLEIKSGAKGKMRSLAMFLENYKAKMGVKISQAKYDGELPIISVPFYSIEGFLKQ
ncbi:MAG: ATP-binding protein [Chlorobi bacterium]|nr:ATP-binding protein [Chlorobiota bacterium]